MAASQHKNALTQQSCRVGRSVAFLHFTRWSKLASKWLWIPVLGTFSRFSFHCYWISVFVLLLLIICALHSTCQQNCSSVWFQIWWDPLLTNWGKGRGNRGNEDHFDLLGSQIRSLSDNWNRQRRMSCNTLSPPCNSLDLEGTLF